MHNLAVAHHKVTDWFCYTCKRHIENESMIGIVMDPPSYEPEQTNRFVLCVSCATHLAHCIQVAMLNIIRIDK